MARTYQRQRGKVTAIPKSKKGVRQPAAPRKRDRKKESRQAQILYWAGILSLACVVVALAFVAGGIWGSSRP